MSCWRVLDLSEPPHGVQVPQLLVKPDFSTDSYTVHLTCLSNIWSEKLDLQGIVERAAQEQVPIEVSKQDTTQLAILLQNVEKSLGSSDNASCRISQLGHDGMTVHTSIALPAPLDSLTWKFCLKKRNSITLKNELILPLLISSHIQHERISRLISTINEKDKAITRLVDQFESSNLDLAAAFPVISGLKSGRRTIKREQAAKHVPALQPFDELAFKNGTANLENPDISTLGLFQEALSECTPQVPRKLEANEDALVWWDHLPRHLAPIRAAPKAKPLSNEKPPKAQQRQDEASSEDETEDEFEVHDNFKTRTTGTAGTKAPPRSDLAHNNNNTDSEATEDDGNLDVMPSQKSLTLRTSPTPATQPDDLPPAKPKGAGFRIGGKSKPVTKSPPPVEDGMSDGNADDLPVRQAVYSPVDPIVEASPKKAKKGFKIGGKGKGVSAKSSQAKPPASQATQLGESAGSPASQPPSSPSAPLARKEPSPEVPQREETAEEKAERRRAELKRKTDEAAKKQAQQKKKRRF